MGRTTWLFLALLFALTVVEANWFGQCGSNWGNWKWPGPFRRNGEGEGERSKGHNHPPHGEGHGECGHDHSDHGGEGGPFFCGSRYRYVTVNNGAVQFGKKRWRCSDTMFDFTMQSIVERGSDGNAVTSAPFGTAGSHSVNFNGGANGGSVVGLMRSSTYQGVAACQLTVVFPLFPGSNMTIDFFIFSGNGRVIDGGYWREVTDGSVQMVVTINNWPFCQTGQPGCNQAGQYLDFEINAQSVGCLTFPSCCPSDSQQYFIGLGVYLVLPRMVNVDGVNTYQFNNQPTLNNKLITNNFPKFNRILTWNPLLTIAKPLSNWTPNCPIPVSSSVSTQHNPQSSTVAPNPQLSSSQAPNNNPQSSSQPQQNNVPSSSGQQQQQLGSSSNAPVSQLSSSAAGNGGESGGGVFQSSTLETGGTHFPESSTGGNNPEPDMSSSQPPIEVLTSSSSSYYPGPICVDPQDDPRFDPWHPQVLNGTCGNHMCNVTLIPSTSQFVGVAPVPYDVTCLNNQSVLSGTVCAVSCLPGFQPEGFAMCLNSTWQSDADVPCSPIPIAVLNITGNGTDPCVAVANGNPGNTVMLTCQGKGLNGQVLEVAFFDPQLVQLPPQFIGEPEPPVSITITDPNGNPHTGPTPPGEFFLFRVCKSTFRSNQPIQLYQTDDYGAHWTSASLYCDQLDITSTVTFVPATPVTPIPCWQFTVCHTTVFIAGPVSAGSEMSKGALIGIIVGSLLGICAIILAVLLYRRNKSPSRYHDLEGTGAYGSGTSYVPLDDNRETGTTSPYEPPPERQKK